MASQSQHVQEPTSFSLTETIVERREASTQDSKSFGIEDIETTTTPLPLFGTRPHPRERTTFDPRTLPPVIPPDHPNRTLILCFDGTGDQFDADNSNIVQLVSLLKKDERAKQLVYYQTGIGTYTSPKIATPWISRIRKTLDTMFASSIHAHVMSGYEFLMQSYTAGDRICIFGFSRGAYTARSLAGMVHKVGLLPPNNFEQVPFAYKMYSRTDTIGWEQSNEFKKAFCINVNIEFIGVWDTVDSVGILPKRLPFTTSNTTVKTFRHAVSLDERRAKFKANLWNRPTDDEVHLGLPDPGDHSVGPNVPLLSKEATIDSDEVSLLFRDDKKRKEKTSGQATKSRRGRGMSLGIRTVNSDDKLMNAYERIYSEKNERMTDIEEVWFAGCHCDVGGGSVSNKTRHSLARIPLRWMIREIFRAQAGILFITERLTEIGIDPSSLYPLVIPRPNALPVGESKIRKHPVKEIPIRPHMVFTKNRPTVADVSKPPPVTMLASEEEEELMDALSPMYDQLKLKKGWWLLEIVPLQLRYQRGNNTWVTYFGLNHAKPRFIPKQQAHGLKVHRSVKLRMEAEYEDDRKRQKGKKYEPRPEFKVEPTWVD